MAVYDIVSGADSTGGFDSLYIDMRTSVSPDLCTTRIASATRLRCGAVCPPTASCYKYEVNSPLGPHLTGTVSDTQDYHLHYEDVPPLAACWLSLRDPERRV